MVQMNKQEADIRRHVKLAKPAHRALAGAGITTLKQLSSLSEKEVSSLHGIGKDALLKIQEALNENGLSFAMK